ncbi:MULTISPECIES: hypothetical protein [Mycobacteroides]|uniref:Uncharacterized protein n=1 Tax=Mycobacteroides chelonae TaxID=1774 RepID=A0A1S1LTC1_MYCCH|nr:MULTISPECIES: hypothetical protein [Mycobacteroides]OHU19948.1 hypothetical protein BKG74_12520 [Mycobacteroides chelonae]OHU58185.1 hypothetical protein BKG82_11305 [Mycobacteroides chelonae]OHU69820.1 hypothetical protein BKG86_07770 [Mycobacteroides chelonae]
MHLVVMAVLPLALLVGCGDGGLDTPRAAADTSAATPTEVALPASSVVFEDDARILDSRPMTFDTWSRSPDSTAVIVYFTSGTPQCHGVHATVRETDDAVAVALRGGTPPEAAGKACILIAVQGSLAVPLATPLGDRRVLSVS